MSITSGFFDHKMGDRTYTANQMGRIFDGIILDGVYSTYGNCFAVTAHQGMTVNVDTGRAWFNHTWILNDALQPMTAEESEILLDRIDALVFDIDNNIDVRANTLKWVRGTGSTAPVKPELINEDEHHQYPLAYVYIKARATEILQEDIEYCVGTDACPFVTGLLQQVSIQTLINQWASEFDNYFRTFQQTYISDWNNWSAGQKSLFLTWMNSEETSFDTWLDGIKDSLHNLPPSTAEYLQTEIDDIRESCMSGSFITLTTINSELVGRDVVVTGDDDVKTAKFEAKTGPGGTIIMQAIVRGVMSVGQLHIEATDGSRTAEIYETIPYFGNYKYDLNFWAAYIKVTTTDDVFYGQPIKVYKDGVHIATTVFDSMGVCRYTAMDPGVYKFTCDYDGETYSSSDVNVTAETTYTTTIGIGFDIQAWLTAGRVTKTFSSLDEILEDEETLRQLMTVHDAVDYLAAVI